MPVFSAQISSLTSIGPIMDVQISPSREAILAMEKAGASVPTPITVSALIDTGASLSVIQRGLPKQLGLHPVGVQYINTASSENIACSQYALQLLLQATGGIRIPVSFAALFTEAPLRGQNIQCLLGRDFLAHCVLVYTGPTNSFVLSL